MTQKIWRSSAPRVFIVHRAEIFQIFWVIFGSNENFKICFRDLLTFSVTVLFKSFIDFDKSYVYYLGKEYFMCYC